MTPLDHQNSTTSILDEIVSRHGLIYLGTVELRPLFLETSRFRAWLDEGRHASMLFLTRHQEIRSDPRNLLDGAKTAIIVGLPYSQKDKLPRKGDPPRIAQYSRLSDYHRLIRKQGEKILMEIHRYWGVPLAAGRVVTDSAPILERAVAASAGMGFIGKNTCFISPRHGSFLLLGELLTSLELDRQAPKPLDPPKGQRTAQGGCGTCRRCQVHCPTGALDQDYRIDARRCLAYWTIEHRGTIPEDFWPWLGQYVFGCDICQITCPYNRGTKPEAPRQHLKLDPSPDLFQMATMTQGDYERLFGGTPLTRAKREGLMRNALIAMKVTEHPLLSSAIHHHLALRESEVVLETISQIEKWVPKT